MPRTSHRTVELPAETAASLRLGTEAETSLAKAPVPPTRPGRDAVSKPTPIPSRPFRKTDRLITMLQAEQGASIEEISSELGWLPHSTRAALTGLRKAGHDIERLKLDDGPSRYRIGSSGVPAQHAGPAPEVG